MRSGGPILSAVAFAANEFLKSANWKDALDDALEQLGTAVCANRAYFFENSFSDSGELLTSQIAEWTAPGISSQIDNSDLQKFPYVAAGVGRWVDIMSQRMPVHGLVSEFPEAEREILSAQDIRSVVVMPVFVHDEFAGFIGFDDCENLRQWEASEFDALFAAATALGAAIERQHLEDQLRFSQKMDAIGNLAAGVAHDFNNMLQAIVGLAHIAKSKVGQDHPVQEELDEIIVASDRSETLTRQLLVFSSKQDAMHEVLDLGETCESVRTMVRPILGASIALSLKVDEPAPTIFVNAGLFVQVLMNLCINARDAMPDGGELEIKCNSVELDDASIGQNSTALPGKFACVTISDTGSGMTPEISEKIFEPFFTTKEQGEGTGLGLSVAYGIVRQCGGLIKVKSMVGAGTSFSIYVPITEKTKYKTSPAPPVPGSETILVVDDEQLVLESTVVFLEAVGYKLLTADNGLDALEIYRTHYEQISLVLTDSSMPGMEGAALLQEALKINSDVKAVMFSGYVTDVPDWLKNNKNISVLQKPLQPDKLTEIIRELLDKQTLNN